MRRISATLGVLLVVAARSSSAVSFGQADTFQDSTTMNWRQGDNAFTPPSNVGSGGPSGAGDAYLRIVSNGSFGSNSKMTYFNTSQWTGDYVTARVDRITAHMANSGPATLFMRIALQSANGTVYGSSTAATLPPDGVWRVVNFDLTESTLTNIGGGETVAQALTHIIDARFVSAVGGASFKGDPVQATLGMDNVVGHDIANFVLRVTNVTRPSGTPRIRFTTINGRSHRVERSDSLTSPNWTALSNAANVTGTGQEVEVDDLDNPANSAARFYRVVLLP